MRTIQSSMLVDTGGRSQKLAISGASAQSAVIAYEEVVVNSTVDCYVRQGANPIALASGVDQFIPAFTPMRLDGIVPGNMLAFITEGGTGSVRISPAA